MHRDASNTRPPRLGPSFPIYPHHRQLLLTVQQQGGVWLSQVGQYDGVKTLRAREQAYLFEPNPIPLSAGVWYRARLVGWYDGSAGRLPLYVTGQLCCMGVSLASASSFSSSSSSPSLSSSASPGSVASPILPPPASPSSSSFPFPFSLSLGSLPSSSSSLKLIPNACCPQGVPAALLVIFSITNLDPITGCPCLENFELIINIVSTTANGGAIWQGNAPTTCATLPTLYATLTCQVDMMGNTSWLFQASCDPNNFPNWNALTLSCDPFHQAWAIGFDQAFIGCCPVNSGATADILPPP